MLIFRAVILKLRLASAIQQLNPKLPAAAVEEVVHVVTTPTEESLPRNNYAFHRLLMDGVKVEFTNVEGEKETDHAQLIDFQNPAPSAPSACCATNCATAARVSFSASLRPRFILARLLTLIGLSPSTHSRQRRTRKSSADRTAG